MSSEQCIVNIIKKNNHYNIICLLFNIRVIILYYVYIYCISDYYFGVGTYFGRCIHYKERTIID